MNVLTQAKTLKSQKQGFTIIEVVLVLAIAGLIFLMVFIALPALQRNQRDTQRKADMGRLSTAIVSYTGANRGLLPTNWQTFEASYLTPTSSDTFIDPAGPTSTQGSTTTTYVLTSSTKTLTGLYATTGAGAGLQNTIYYSVGYTCGTTNDSITNAGARKVAFRMALEGGGYDCVSN